MKKLLGIFPLIICLILLFILWLPKSVVPYQPRILNQIYAGLHGYFWLPCPICGNHFGGHEWKESLNITSYKGIGVCSQCTELAKESNRIRFTEDDKWFNEKRKRMLVL